MKKLFGLLLTLLPLLEYGNLYAIGLWGKMNMVEDVTNVDDPPIANFYRTAENDLLAGTSASGNPAYENIPEANNKGSDFTPAGNVSVPVKGMEAVVDLRTEEFAEQNKLLDLLAQIAQEKVEVDTANFPLFSEPFTNSEKVPTTPIQVEQLLDIVILVAEFLEENEIVEKAKSLKDFLEYLKSKGLDMQELDITENILLLKVHLLKNLTEQAISKIKEPIEQTERKVQIFVSTKVNGLVDTAMLSATQLMNNTFEQARPSLLALSPEDSIFIDKSISVAKKSIVGNIDRAVKDAVDKKVVDAINNFIHTALAERLYGLVDSIVGNSLYSLAEGEKPDLSNVSDELSDALEDIEQDVLKFISFDNIGRMLKYTALIAWDDVDMGKIIGDILQELPRKKLQTCRAKAPE